MRHFFTIFLVVVSLHSIGQSPFYRLGGVGGDSSGDTRECVLETAQSQIGVTEATGNNDGEVVKYLESVGFKEGYAWCGAFIHWTIDQCSDANQLTPSRSWAWTPNYMKLDTRDPNTYNAEPGDLILLYYQKLGRVGHVGFVEYWSSGNLAVTIEGNTNSKGVREGDGVRVKYRNKKQIYRVVKMNYS